MTLRWRPGRLWLGAAGALVLLCTGFAWGNGGDGHGWRSPWPRSSVNTSAARCSSVRTERAVCNSI